MCHGLRGEKIHLCSALLVPGGLHHFPFSLHSLDRGVVWTRSLLWHSVCLECALPSGSIAEGRPMKVAAESASGMIETLYFPGGLYGKPYKHQGSNP